MFESRNKYPCLERFSIWQMTARERQQGCAIVSIQLLSTFVLVENTRKTCLVVRNLRLTLRPAKTVLRARDLVWRSLDQRLVPAISNSPHPVDDPDGGEYASPVYPKQEAVARSGVRTGHYLPTDAIPVLDQRLQQVVRVGIVSHGPGVA